MQLVSILMPAYNAERYLSAAIESVLSQTYPQWELLIVNDGSTDGTQAMAERYQQQDPRIKVLNQNVNGGIAKARNRALDEANGRYIAFLDSDDLWIPDKLEKQLAFMTARKVSVSYGAYQRINEQGQHLGSVWPVQQLDYATLLKSNFIGNLTGIYDAEVLGKQYFGEFKHEDYVAWLALVKRAGKAMSINLELGSYRIYTDSTSANKFKAALWQWRIYRHSEHLSIAQSCYLMVHYFYYAVQKRL
jgi:teichuronic acid biosynthesis glycosyltransferase TuaG